MDTQEANEQAPGGQEASGGSSASTVASGIFSSKVLGLVREGSLSYFFGVSPYADVYQAAFKTPNLLQNLLGEGTISAAFIPIYSRMLEEGRREEAGRFAGAIFGLLLAVAASIVLAGMLLAPYLVALLAPGFLQDAGGTLPFPLSEFAEFMQRVLSVGTETTEVNRFDLTVQTVRIVFPMTGVLVLSAWALGVLNSHRRFFLPYVAPVVWNVAIIASLFGTAQFLLPVDPLGFADLSDAALTQLLFAACFGALAGGVLQFMVQLPLVAKVIRGFRFSISRKVEGVKEAIEAFWPVVAGRGVYQLSAYVDLLLGSLIAGGGLAALRFAQTLYILPISLFGLSVAAAELPELSRIREEQVESFLGRIDRSMRQMMFMIIPTLVGYLGFGFLIVGLLFRQGKFGLNDNWLTFMVLGGYTMGLWATALSRLLQNSFYALGDTKTPAKIAVIRVLMSAAVAVPLMFWLDQFSVAQTFGFSRAQAADELFLGAVGLSIGASAGACVELGALLRSLKSKLGRFPLPWSDLPRMVGLALAALGPALLLWWGLADWSPKVLGPLVLAAFGGVYLAGAFALDFPEVKAWGGRLLQRFL